jgi:hypothetical protein
VDLTEQHRLARAKINQRLLRARGALSLFTEAVCKDDHGEPLVLSTMHAQWIAHLRYCWDRGLKAVVLAHFGSGKSSTLAVPLAAWALGHDPNKRVKIVTNDDGNAVRRVAGIERIFESHAYRAMFRGVRRGKVWKDHELFLQRPGHALDPSVHARGVFTTGIGGRADLLIFDDVVDQKNAFDVGQRKKVLDLIEQTWLSRLEPDGKVLYIATLWHMDDATHHLMKRPGWCTLTQRVADNCATIEQEVSGAGPDYGWVGQGVQVPELVAGD